MTSDSGSGDGGGGRGQNRNKQLISEYNQIVLAAQVKVGEDVDKLLSDAAHLLETAGRNYTHAVEQGRQAFKRIHEPAHDNYQRQFDMALSVQAAIVNPAEEELKRITQSVKELIEQAIHPIEQIYSEALSAASSVAGNISPGGGIL